MAGWLLSRSSFDDATEVEAGQSAPVPLSPNCFPRSQSDQRIPHQTTGAIGMPNFMCARHKLNPVLGEDRAHERSVVATCEHGYSIPNVCVLAAKGPPLHVSWRSHPWMFRLPAPPPLLPEVD